jgi:hypothetical protein
MHVAQAICEMHLLYAADISLANECVRFSQERVPHLPMAPRKQLHAMDGFVSVARSVTPRRHISNRLDMREAE